MTRTTVVAGAFAAVLVLVAGCGSDEPLSDDHDGQEACDQLVVALEHSDDVAAKVAALMKAAEAAQDADTAAIKDSLADPIEGLEDLPTVDIDKLTAACEDAGVDVPK